MRMGTSGTYVARLIPLPSTTLLTLQCRAWEFAAQRVGTSPGTHAWIADDLVDVNRRPLPIGPYCDKKGLAGSIECRHSWQKNSLLTWVTRLVVASPIVPIN